jgi:hypothetical protein
MPPQELDGSAAIILGEEFLGQQHVSGVFATAGFKFLNPGVVGFAFGALTVH